MTAFRRSRILANVLGAGGVRLVSMAVTIVSVPLLLQILGREQYGVWVTLTSILLWFGVLDLGVGNSLRNTVSAMIDESVRPRVQEEFKDLLHVLVAVALIAISVIFVALNYFTFLSSHKAAAILIYVPALLLVPLMLGNSVLQGAGKIALQAALQASPAWIFFLFIAYCSFSGLQPELHIFALAWSTFSVLFAVVTFTLALRFLRLSAADLISRKTSVKPWGRLKVGLSFLLLQIATVVIYSMGNVIVYNGLGPSEVARYDVANKVFQVCLGVFGVSIAVMWSEISRLRALADWAGLRGIHRRMLWLAVAFSVGVMLVAWLMPTVIEVWTQKAVTIGRSEAFALASLVSLQAIAYVGAVFLNAFERIKVQVGMAVVSIIMMYPLSHTLLKAGLGIAAVPIAAAVLTLLPLVVCNIQAHRLLRATAHA